jgi:hypothetical protein
MRSSDRLNMARLIATASECEEVGPPAAIPHAPMIARFA